VFVDFLVISRVTMKLMKRGFIVAKVKSSLRTLYRNDVVNCYGVSVSETKPGMFYLP
jgi:hypothetical protein